MDIKLRFEAQLLEEEEREMSSPLLSHSAEMEWTASLQRCRSEKVSVAVSQQLG